MHGEVWNRRQAIAALSSGVVFILALAWLLLTPAPYAVQSPGPTINTLGEYRDIQLISITGTETYPDPESELRLTTVVAAGGPGYPVNVANAIRGWLSATSTVLPREALYVPDITQEEMDDQARQQMTRSQHDAAVMALAELGIDVPVVLEVAGTDPAAASHQVVREGDTLTAISTPAAGKVPITVYPDLADTLAATPPGTDVTLHVIRDGEDQDVTFVTADDGFGGSLLGIFLNPDFDMPFDIDIEVEKVGGPSAGTMFALGIIDLLTPGPIAGEAVVAGTGTIGLNGRVGPIGGIRQKMHGALRDGAQYFLAPGQNCDQVRGNIPRGLTVLRVDTLTDAFQAVEAIGTGDVEGLPTCEAA